MKGSSEKVFVDPLVDSPPLTPPPPKSYWIAPTQRHITSKRSGKEAQCKWCKERNPLSEREPTAFMLFGALSAYSTASGKCCLWGGGGCHFIEEGLHESPGWLAVCVGGGGGVTSESDNGGEAAIEDVLQTTAIVVDLQTFHQKYIRQYYTLRPPPHPTTGCGVGGDWGWGVF